MASPPATPTALAEDSKSIYSQDGKDVDSSASSIDLQKEVFDVNKIDPVLAKMALVNDAIEAIGMTPFQWKLFFLNGFGYTVDSVYSSNSQHA